MRRVFGLVAILSLACLSGCSRSSSSDSQTAQQPAPPAQPAPSSSPSAAPPAPAAPAGSSDTAAQAPAAAAPQPAPPQPVVVAAGTTLTVRTAQALGSKISKTGDSFAANLTKSISVDGSIAIPATSRVTGSVVNATAKGKVKGAGELDLTLTSITIQGRSYQISTNTLQQTIKGKGKRTAATTGGGAAGGALIGGLAGGGKGAAIGAGIGAGAGFIGGAATGNQQIELPAESVLTFRLSQPITLSP